MTLPAGLVPIEEDLPTGLTPIQADAPKEELGFFEKFSQETMQPRREAIRQTVQDIQTGEVGKILGGIQLAGNSVILPLLWDLPGDVLETAFQELPEEWQQDISQGAENFFNTGHGQEIAKAASSVAKDYAKVKKKYPQETKAFESLVPLLGLKVGSFVTKGAKKTKRTVGNILRSARAVKRSAPPPAQAQKALKAISPPGTVRQLEAEAENMLITGRGHFIPTPSPVQQRMIDATSTVKGFNVNNAAQLNLNAVKEEVRILDKFLVKELKDLKIPLKHNEMTRAVEKKVGDIMGRGKPELMNELVTDMPKSTVEKVLRKVNRISRAHPPTAEGQFAARKAVDRLVTTKWRAFFSPDGTSTPIKELYDEIRTAMNGAVERSVRQNTMRTGKSGPHVFETLSRERTLINVKEILKTKTPGEGRTPLKRLLQKVDEAIPQRGMRFKHKK